MTLRVLGQRSLFLKGTLSPLSGLSSQQLVRFNCSLRMELTVVTPAWCWNATGVSRGRRGWFTTSCSVAELAVCTPGLAVACQS